MDINKGMVEGNEEEFEQFLNELFEEIYRKYGLYMSRL